MPKLMDIKKWRQLRWHFPSNNFFICVTYFQVMKNDTVSITSFSSFQSFLTFMFVKQIALKMQRHLSGVLAKF